MLAQKEWPFGTGLGMNRTGRLIAACRKEEDGETLEAQMSANPTLSKENSRSHFKGRTSQG